MKERLHKIIARSGIASRRKAEILIQEGRVKVNGAVVNELGTQVDPHRVVIDIDDMPITPAENKVYVLLNKPHGYITSTRDPEGRPTVLQLINNIQERIFPVGRLDYDTEGLLLMTNDGQFAQILQHPRHEVDRTYLVKIKGLPSPAKLEKLQQGIYIEGMKTNKARIRIVRRSQKNMWLELILREGRNRQIKKMFEAIGHSALRIIRTKFGPIHLDDLPTGSYRFLKKKEIDAIMKIIP
jgi:pseudouridine synthase